MLGDFKQEDKMGPAWSIQDRDQTIWETTGS